jgi:Response regulator containing a CheY-like receiver domain and an HTH DNA-binding domain
MVKPPGEVRILIADDHAVFRYGLRTLLESESGFTVVGEAVDGSEVVPLATALKPHVLMLDLAMPRLTGIEVLRELSSSANGQMRTIVVTAAIEKRQIIEALQLGARGILLKSGAMELVTKCVEKVLANEFWVGREVVTGLVDYLQKMTTGMEQRVGPGSPDFTPREREIVSAILAGRMNKEIAAQLLISEDTVKRHLSNIFAKAGVSNRLELAIWSTKGSA